MALKLAVSTKIVEDNSTKEKFTGVYLSPVQLSYFRNKLQLQKQTDIARTVFLDYIKRNFEDFPF
jgi:hypothetical protein